MVEINIRIPLKKTKQKIKYKKIQTEYMEKEHEKVQNT